MARKRKLLGWVEAWDKSEEKALRQTLKGDSAFAEPGEASRQVLEGESNRRTSRARNAYGGDDEFSMTIPPERAAVVRPKRRPSEAKPNDGFEPEGHGD